MNRVTMNDVAKKANVTKATVSMVVNNDKRISEKTRRKVTKIIRELNYYPNELARNFARGKTGNIAFLTPHFASPFIGSILEAFEKRALNTQKYVNGIQPFATWNSIAIMEDFLRKMLYGRRVDAVVILTQKPSPETIREYRQRKIPLILIENRHPLAHSVQIDNVKGGYQATEYLIKKGKRNIGIIVGELETPKGVSVNYTAGDRLQGYQEALKFHHLAFDPDRAATITDYEFNEGRLAVDRLLGTKKPLDALFCAAGDMVALGAMERLKELGKNIPEDVALVGYDDIFAARLPQPSLTTVRQPFNEIAVMAFDMGIEAISGKLKKEKHVVLAPEIIPRESA